LRTYKNKTATPREEEGIAVFFAAPSGRRKRVPYLGQGCGDLREEERGHRS